MMFVEGKAAKLNIGENGDHTVISAWLTGPTQSILQLELA